MNKFIIIPMKQKVFGLGFHKTGTSSLASSLHVLGYKVCGQQNILHQDLINGNFSKFVELANNFDAFEDDPWHLLYKEMDKTYPNSKFILTYRDVESWYKSCLNHFYEDTTPIRDYIYMAMALRKTMKKNLNKFIMIT